MWFSSRTSTSTKMILSSMIVASLLIATVSSSATTNAAKSDESSTTNTKFSNILTNINVDTHPTITTVAAANTKRGNGPCATGAPNSYTEHPVLCEMLDRLEENAEELASEITNFARKHGLLMGENWESRHFEQQQQQQSSQNDQQLPVVFAHGMGDSCFNSGMIHIGNHTSELLGGTYVVCVPTGDTQTDDTTNGYFLNMDKSVDVFASKIASDPKLQKGFHAIGFSQGNNVIRGYIARYNTPTVHTFVSVNGVNAGEGTVPGCFPKTNKEETDGWGGSICDLLLEQASRRAYTEFAQEHSFQGNYWRDPRLSKQDDYHQYSQLARWNNEGPNNHNQTFNDNFAKTTKFVWVMATNDSMVWPKEGEHWGCPDNSGGKDPFASPILPMNETEWYQKDLFGLRTAQEEGKNVFETFEGDHLQFTMEDFDRWVTSYLSSSPSTIQENRPSMALQQQE